MMIYIWKNLDEDKRVKVLCERAQPTLIIISERDDEQMLRMRLSIVCICEFYFH